jgi:3D (Asp-Asp-Asp) domain-containing protein
MVILYEDGSVEIGKALDTGGALRVPGVRKVDVFRRTYKEASRHGIRRATVLWRGKELSQDE